MMFSIHFLKFLIKNDKIRYFPEKTWFFFKKEFTENSILSPISPNFTKNFQMASETDFHVETKLNDVFYTFSEFLNKK